MGYSLNLKTMLRWIKRWWKSATNQNLIYVVTYIGDHDELVPVCFYDMKEAADYAAAIERVTGRVIHINCAELL